MMNFLTETVQSILLRPQRSIGPLRADVVIEESHEDSITRMEHPVESGAAVSDHAYVNAPSVTIRGGVSDSGKILSGARPGAEFYEKLRALQASLEPFDIITGKRIYKNMMLDRLSVVTDADHENALLFTAECSEIRMARTRTASVPPRSVQKYPHKTASPVDKGHKQVQERTAEQRRKDLSILEGIFG